MIERFFRAVAAWVYGGFETGTDARRRAEAKAFAQMKARREAEFERLVLTGK